MKHTKLLFQLVLTLNSSVMRAEYTRYWFDPQKWKTKQGPTTGFQGTVILDLAITPRPDGPPVSGTGRAEPRGGFRYHDFDARIVQVVSPVPDRPAAGPQAPQIYQGLLNMPSGSGWEAVLCLYPEGESYLRHTFLQGPVDWTTKYGTWKDDGLVVQVTPTTPMAFLFSWCPWGPSRATRPP